MIEVDKLSKRFGNVRALNDVSFAVSEGEIMGFLGPNGAGKSTTMRILTGFLPGDSGTVRVAGHDVRSESLFVRQSVGYLPEGVPLYPDMRVREYLSYRAKLKGVPRSERRKMVHDALESTAIVDVERRIIGTLSRGYRQRVGLADALLAKPRVLILDEPTVGLDPEQVRQFRQLLRDVGRDRTIILSTHILSEVELVCSAVVIIHQGSIVARDTGDNLRHRFGGERRVVAEIAASAESVRSALQGKPGVVRVEAQPLEGCGGDYQRFVVDCDGDVDLRLAVYEAACLHDWKLRELRSEERSLEDAFVGIVADGAESKRKVGEGAQ